MKRNFSLSSKYIGMQMLDAMIPSQGIKLHCEGMRIDLVGNYPIDGTNWITVWAGFEFLELTLDQNELSIFGWI